MLRPKRTLYVARGALTMSGQGSEWTVKQNAFTGV
jgi:hypothetical protein